MEAARSAAIALGGMIAFVGGLAFLFAGAWEIALGRRPPGILGWEMLNRSRSTSSAWTETRWRRNGFQVIVMGIGLVMLALWAVAAAFNVTG